MEEIPIMSYLPDSYKVRSGPGVSGVCPAAGLKSGQFNLIKNFWGTVPKSAVVGFRIS